MRPSALICALLVSCVGAFGREHKSVAPLPDHLALGRHTFVDFGPPNDFYELYLLQKTPAGTLVERITLTPPGGSCMQPAKVETASGSINQPLAMVLNGLNPCSISDKEVNRELKRCKKCLVFTYANVTMQAQCGARTRIIRAHILDKDIYDPAAKTPPQTSWTMQLLDRLDQVVGPGVMNQPVFPVSAPQASARQHSPALDAVSQGSYDGLFQGAPDKPSDLYRLSQLAVPSPDIRINVNGARAEKLTPPLYPPLARLANIGGTVSVRFKIDTDGGTTAITFENGHPMLRSAVEKAVSSWKFPKESAGREIQATVEFNPNCQRPAS